MKKTHSGNLTINKNSRRTERKSPHNTEEKNEALCAVKNRLLIKKVTCETRKEFLYLAIQ